MVGNSLMFSPA